VGRVYEVRKTAHLVEDETVLCWDNRISMISWVFKGSHEGSDNQEIDVRPKQPAIIIPNRIELGRINQQGEQIEGIETCG